MISPSYLQGVCILQASRKLSVRSALQPSAGQNVLFAYVIHVCSSFFPFDFYVLVFDMLFAVMLTCLPVCMQTRSFACMFAGILVQLLDY